MAIYHPERFAVYSEHEKIRMTFPQLFQKARNLASGLLSLEFKEKTQPRIAVFSPNVIEYYIA